ncbi:MAG TPA: phage BR0599 family protein [Methyloceanibacter sp.]|nr:phage BR0599 family protein [Methyloceanibacter sp.]
MASRRKASRCDARAVAGDGQGRGAGDAFTIIAGCDKHFKTCKVKFANSVDLRGFLRCRGSTSLWPCLTAGPRTTAEA